MGETIVFTSGKGGVGKTTAVANIGTELSLLDKKVIMLDADMGLRNLDVVMGLENRITYNLADLLNSRCRINQAVIRDKRYPNLFMIPAALTYERLWEKRREFGALLAVLKKEYDYCLIDSPAGIEDGFRFAIAQADRAIVVTTPHISAVRDAERVLWLLEENRFLGTRLIINQLKPRLIRRHNMLSVQDIEEILGVPAIGCISADEKIIISQNQGVPVTSLRSVSGRQFRLLARRLDLEKPQAVDLSIDDVHRERHLHVSPGKEYRYEIS